MEGTLFNQGFLGSGSFNWWVGQIADDSTWRDNILPGKFEDKDQIPGWGYRYKVRIIGYHDKEEEIIQSDQLPWAQVMYPVTAGGGQGGSSSTANLRQGNFVFGFFLDGSDAQVPVIMGILGNNAQTPLGTQIGTTKSNFSGTSGYSKGSNPDPNIKVPAEGLGITKPKPPGNTTPVTPKPGTKPLDGRDPARPPTKREFAAAQSARAESDRLGETGTVREARIRDATIAATKAEAQESQSPDSPAQPGATRESVNAVHQQSAADIQRNELYEKKRVLMSPCDMVGSAMKAIQAIIENLTREIDKKLHALQSYVDAVSDVLGTIQSIIADAACQIAKYMKIIFDKIMEYVLKQINTALAKAVNIIPPNLRSQFIDIKDKILELILCLYNKITKNLCGQIQNLLNAQNQNQNQTQNQNQNQNQNAFGLNITTATPDNSTVITPMCSVEYLTGAIIGANLTQMNKVNDDVLRMSNSFLNDVVSQIDSVSGTTSGIGDIFSEINDGISQVQGAVGQVSDGISKVRGIVSGINGSLSAGLNFENIKLNIFGCELKPGCPVSDFYTLDKGSGSTDDPQEPRPTEVSELSEEGEPLSSKETPFAQPPANAPNLNHKEQAKTAAQSERDLEKKGIVNPKTGKQDYLDLSG